MKKRIEQFVKTFFYFNSQERKGIFLLLGLIFLSLISKWSLAFLMPPEPIEVSIQTLNDFDTTEGMAEGGYSFEKYKSDSFHNRSRNAGISSKYSSFQARKDTVYPIRKKKVFTSLEMNSADSVSLVELYRIGPNLASKIISYRTKLGGFKNLDQLTEIWGFDADILYDLEGKIYVDPTKSQRFNLNTVTLEQLKLHPYFKYNLSQAIINYRKQHGNYQQLNDLKNIKFVTDSILRKIEPYIIIE